MKDKHLGLPPERKRRNGQGNVPPECERRKTQGEISPEQKTYLKNLRKRKIFVHSGRIGILVLLVGLWELLADVGVIDPFITGSPSRIAACIASLVRDGSIWKHVGVTVLETLLGFFLAVFSGTIVALLLWWSEGAQKILEPYLVVLNALPKIALGPLIIIWFGTGYKAIVVMTVLVGLIVAIMNMLSAFSATDKNKILLLKSLGASKLQILTKLVIPASRAAFMNMLKICLGLAWIGSIMGEYIVSKAGLGYLIVYGGQVFKLDLVMSAVLILCFLAAAMYFIIHLVEVRLSRKK